MATPIPFSPDVETVRDDEPQTFAEMVETFRSIQETTFKDYGHAVRGVHAKSHGIVVGSLEVLDGLEPSLAQGLCAYPGRHDAVLRFSTTPGDILDDSVSTPRGVALKVLKVAGERLDGAEGSTQDFVLVNSPTFAAPDAKAFLRILKLLAATTDTPQILKKGLSAALRGLEHVVEAVGGKSSTLIGLGGHPETHILGETFYSQVPIRWGEFVAKVALVPVSSSLKALTDAPLNLNGKPNGLREAVKVFFDEEDGVWELRVQLRTDADTMPVDDGTVAWPETESPYRPVARLTVHRQDSWTSEAQAVEDGLAFSPWHGIVAHRPLGSVMRARRAAYPRSAAFRSEHNGCPIREPRHLSELGSPAGRVGTV